MKHTFSVLDTVGDSDVSTVFVGLDMRYDLGVGLDMRYDLGRGAPVLWETMVFGGLHDQYQERYTTRAEALAGHARAIEMVSR